MSDYSDPAGRRKFLKLLGGSVAMIPLANLTGCSGEKDAPAPAAKPAAKPAAAAESMAEKATAAAGETAAAVQEQAEEMVETAKETVQSAAGDLPQLSEDDPQAKALGYVHDAGKVDGGKYPRYQAGQLCSNCALFQAKGDEAWARCSIFPGRLVNADGWCSAYAPKG